MNTDNIYHLQPLHLVQERSATRIEIIRGRVREGFGWFLNKLHIPGAIQPCEIADPVTGNEITIAPGRFYFRISVNGRDYYFDRVSGRFDGTGTGCF